MKKFFGFTLAEVLITLGIIGVVAALVMPVFIKKYYSTAYEQHFDIFTKRLTEASKQMALAYKLGPYEDTEAFVSVFKDYFKLQKVCKSNNLTDCFPSDIKYGEEIISPDDLSKSKNFGKEDYDTDNVGIRFADGLVGIISWNPDCDVVDPYNMKNTDPSSCISYVLDLNGFRKPNQVGRDILAVGADITISRGPELVTIDCVATGDTGCRASQIQVEIIDSTAVEVSESDSKYNSSSNGSRMTWYTAQKTCESKGLSLPTADELKAMYKAASSGKIAPFQSYEYWALGWEPGGVYHNCNMGSGACGSAGYTRLNGLRCVK